jgi:signal transduction histidine kinase
VSSEIDELLTGLRESAWDRKTEALRTITAKLAAGEITEHQEGLMLPLIVAATNHPKWEVQKAAAVALSELRHADVGLVQSTLEGLARDQQTHYVKEAAERALKRIRSRTQRKKEWKLTEDTRDPTLQHIMTRIREIGLRSMTPARIYDLAMEVSEQSYREVAADTAHEMRNIIAPFEGYLVDLREQLADDDVDRDHGRELVALALSRLEHITRLIDDLGVYSAPTAADFSPTNLESLVREAIAVGADRGEQAVAPEGFVKQVIEVPHAIVIDAIADRLLRAITNLVANAYQAMEAGGTLTIRALAMDDDRVSLTIEDTGTGMTPEAVDHARLRFRSTRRAQGGTGLGLPIAVRIIADDHRGELEIDSTPGDGTRITIMLPRRQASELNR